MKRKRKSHYQQLSGAGADILFGIILAALSKFNSDESLTLIIKQCLHELRLSLLQMPQTLKSIPIPILSLLPLFLNSRCAEIASTCLEIVGAASICSFEMNEQIALDADIVKGLLSALSSFETTVSLAAANAVLDLSTTSIGRHRLITFSAIDKLIFCFIQVSKTRVPLVSLFTDEKGSKSCLRIGFKEEEFPVLLLQAAVTLINTCTIELLEKIPRKLSESLRIYLKNLWAQVHKQMLLSTIQKFSPGRHFYLSNIRTNNVAETIFRLSINNVGELTTASNINEVQRSIFSFGEISFEHLMLNHWEVSPVLLRREKDDIFSCFVQQFILKSEKEQSVPFLSSVLQNFITCPPISWDELDVLNFLKEARDDLGCPVIDRQDIRVLKTKQHSSKEMHFFEERSRLGTQSHFLYMDDIMRCEEAFKEGYTIAVRGMELRFESIAAIADGLASLFGQPSAGVNMYLTPPNSQGLARHFDDHCVFVCQLIGVKKWTVFPRSSLLLPRLYASDSGHDIDGGENPITDDECKHFLLKEGDVLYIPRGFPHEACTNVENDGNVPNGNAGFSLHLTLAVEVAPPFEWEGFAHVALHHWDQNENLSQYYNTSSNNDSTSWDLHVVSVNLMHIAIKLIGDVEPTFRKACLVGTTSLTSSGWLDMNQRTTFTHLLNIINKECRFLDALNCIEAAILHKHEDPFLELSWLNHLEGERSCNISSLILTLGKHRDEAEAAFMEVKSKFCSEVVFKFKDVQHSYNTLIDKYRKVRKQYVNGMLSLHRV